jgi:sensor histidine kinase YesM
LCQIGGWGLYGLVNIFFYYTISTRTDSDVYYKTLILFILEGFAISHMMRTVIQQYGLLSLPITRQIITLLSITVVFAFLYSVVDNLMMSQFGLETESMKKYAFGVKVVRTAIGTFFFLCMWNLIYFSYHYILRSRKDQLDKIRLESLVKELELKTIKAHINPHFIFNALNSIRALVDEDPARARTAITELSNILRSSMYAEKVETTPLERELSIVKDYLALEHIRFEDRLRVEYDIDEDTLDLPVPPMMLQTLVENAIKHGISKQKDGGVIKVMSDFKDDHYELVVQNTGHLNGHSLKDGFGISGTINRLHLMFGDSAHFDIKDKDNNLVEAKVVLPA